MNRFTPSAPQADADMPVTLLNWLRSNGVDRDALTPMRRPGPPRPVRRLTGAGYLVDVAVGESGRRRNLLEASGRDWARRQGVATPQVWALGPRGGWLISEHVRAHPVTSGPLLRQAIEVARRIEVAEPPTRITDASTWHAPRRSLPLRAARLVLNGFPAREWRAAQAKVRGLPRDGVAHGDFYYRNVLAPAGTSALVVIDWEYLAPAPHNTDLLRMWSTLQDVESRSVVLEAVLSGTPASAWQTVGELAHWLALRLLGENLSARPGQRDPTTLAHAQLVVGEARRLSRRLVG